MGVPQYASFDWLCERFTVALAASRSEKPWCQERSLKKDTMVCVDDGAWVAGDGSVRRTDVESGY